MVIHATFEPQPDITAYELALIVSKGFGNFMNQMTRFEQAKWDALDPSLKRHFRPLGGTDV